MNFIASTLFSIYKTPDNNQENKYNVHQNVYEFNSNKLVIKNENQIKNAKNVFFFNENTRKFKTILANKRLRLL